MRVISVIVFLRKFLLSFLLYIYVAECVFASPWVEPVGHVNLIFRQYMNVDRTNDSANYLSMYSEVGVNKNLALVLSGGYQYVTRHVYAYFMRMIEQNEDHVLSAGAGVSAMPNLNASILGIISYGYSHNGFFFVTEFKFHNRNIISSVNAGLKFMNKYQVITSLTLDTESNANSSISLVREINGYLSAEAGVGINGSSKDYDNQFFVSLWMKI